MLLGSVAATEIETLFPRARPEVSLCDWAEAWGVDATVEEMGSTEEVEMVGLSPYGEWLLPV